jgi:hypothetical protein
LVLGLVACGSDPANGTGNTPRAEGGGSGDAGIDGAGADSAGTRDDAGGAGSASEAIGGEAGAGGEGGAAGEGAVDATAAAEMALEAALLEEEGAETLITDPSKIAGQSFMLKDFIGPSEAGEELWSTGNYRLDDPERGVEHRFAPRLTFYFWLAGEDDLRAHLEMETETFPYVEDVELVRAGNTWLARDLPTSNHALVTFEDLLNTDYYKAAVARFAFVDSDGDGTPNRLVAAATTSVESTWTLLDGTPVKANDFEANDVVFHGAPDGLALSQGYPLTQDEQTIGVEEVTVLSPRFVTMDTEFRDIPYFRLTRAVSADSKFYVETEAGVRSEVKQIKIGDYVRGLAPFEYFPGNLTLNATGSDLRGEPFHATAHFTVVPIEPAAGDFESPTAWLSEPQYGTFAGYCEGQPAVEESHAGLSAIAGAHSFSTGGCARLRVSRSPGATHLKFDATVAGFCNATPWSREVTILPMIAEQVAEQNLVQLECEQINHVSVPLPATGDDLLVTFPDELWLDSLRTE